VKKTVEVTVLTFCENCGKHRDVFLSRAGQWFIWFCLPCLLRREARVMWQRLKREYRHRRIEAREAREERM
jgi:hypothetical protein